MTERNQYVVQVRKFNPRGGGDRWVAVTYKDSRYEALSAASIYRRANPGAQLRVEQVQDQGAFHQSWSVYELDTGTQIWTRISDWPDQGKAVTAVRLKRLQFPDRVYQIFPTGKAPDPSEEAADIKLARDRRTRAEAIARDLLAACLEDPNRCRAVRRDGSDMIRSQCVRHYDHPARDHETAYEAALSVLRKQEEDEEFRLLGEGPVGGGGPGRAWRPPHSHDGRQDSQPFRPGDPGEEPDDEVTPPGPGSFAAGRGPGRKKEGGA